jgi:hypothetical protein
MSRLDGRFPVTNPQDEVHGSRCAAENAEAGGALGTVAMAVQRDLNHRLRNRDGSAGEGSRLELTIELFLCGAREPSQLEALGLSELGH